MIDEVRLIVNEVHDNESYVTINDIINIAGIQATNRFIKRLKSIKRDYICRCNYLDYRGIYNNSLEVEIIKIE